MLRFAFLPNAEVFRFVLGLADNYSKPNKTFPHISVVCCFQGMIGYEVQVYNVRSKGDEQPAYNTT